MTLSRKRNKSWLRTSPACMQHVMTSPLVTTSCSCQPPIHHWLPNKIRDKHCKAFSQWCGKRCISCSQSTNWLHGIAFAASTKVAFVFCRPDLRGRISYVCVCSRGCEDPWLAKINVLTLMFTFGVQLFAWWRISTYYIQDIVAPRLCTD